MKIAFPSERSWPLRENRLTLFGRSNIAKMTRRQAETVIGRQHLIQRISCSLVSLYTNIDRQSQGIERALFDIETWKALDKGVKATRIGLFLQYFLQCRFLKIAPSPCRGRERCCQMVSAHEDEDTSWL